MELYHHLARAQADTSVALGCFDGVHLGHAAVLRHALNCSPELTPAIFTFGTPENAMPPVKGAPELMSETLKERVLSSLGFHLLYAVNFESLRALSPEEFVFRVLNGTLHARQISCGFNYRFGKGGAGDGALLKKLCAPLGITVRIAPAVLLGGKPVSSTRIRTAVRQGDMPLAAQLLGRPFTIDFPVAHGRQLGRTLGAPTINQPFPPGFILPKFGVYASYACVNGNMLPAVTNIGIKPTVGADAPLAETFITGFCGDLYGQRVSVCLLRFLRGEVKFPSIGALKAQILQDAAAARQIAGEYLI